MATVRAALESLLRARRLDRTLTSALPAASPDDELAVAAAAITQLDARLGGGFPRGQVSELVGPRSSGRASLMLRALAAATARGELVALVDALDMLDVASAAAAGLRLDRLLWIRGYVVSHPGLCRDTNQRALEQAIRALALVLQAGSFGLVVFDLAEAPAEATGRLPFTTWLRLQRMVEGSQTACVLVGTDPMARSSAGLTLELGSACGHAPRASVKRTAREASTSGGGAPREDKKCRDAVPTDVFHGFEININARIVRARTRVNEETTVTFATVAAADV